MGRNQLTIADVAVREVAKARFPEDRREIARGLERAVQKLRDGEYHTDCSECGELIWKWEAEQDYIGRKLCDSCYEEVEN